jgi:protein-S-isoprenylcysteine O-methyltransferase Ste14
MDKKLFIQAITKFTFGFIIIALLLFIPAGTLNYLNAWLFIGILFVPMFIVGIILMIKNPDLLRKRLNSKEKEAEQVILLVIGGVMFICGFVVAGLNYRFEWIILPKYIVYIGTIIFLLAYVLYAEVLRENMYLSRIIEVQENQKVIDTGLYGIVRHPMYLSTILLFLSIPLVLGSLFSFLIFMIYPFIIAKRIKNEEKVLEEGLKGYLEYKEKVKYRVIPFIW